MTSSPFRPGTSIDDQLKYYKTQYEQLEAELHEFQTSSKELEAELEKDVEESEKRERKLKTRVEQLGYEVEEWKTKSKQARDDGNRAQNALQKEITTMRETNRQLVLQLRDIEVANDDYERQARNTTSSLEDLESKYNIAIERSVLLDEDVRNGEKEREKLRIETQRLRDELSDLRVEFDITIEKLQHTETALEKARSGRVAPATLPLRPRTPSEASAATASSLSASTPPVSKSRASGSEMPTPPSPPLSDTLKPSGLGQKATTMNGRKARVSEVSNGGRLTNQSARIASRSGRPSIGLTQRPNHTTKGPRPSIAPSDSLPRSGSLFQIKDLIGRMQKMEQRVQSVRAKLPASASRSSTPRSSPRHETTKSVEMPESVTMRSDRKRPSILPRTDMDGDSGVPGAKANANANASKRLSFGFASPNVDRTQSPVRALSRASHISDSNNSHDQKNPFVRPSSRISTGGSSSRGLLAQYPLAPPARPRSSMSNTSHVSHPFRHKTSHSISEESSIFSTPMVKRISVDRSAIPAPGDDNYVKSTAAAPQVNRRVSHQHFSGTGPERDRSMRPPPPATRRVGGLGETY